MGRSQESVQKGLQELLSSLVGVGLMEFCCISVVKITDICYQGIYLYPLKRIIETDYYIPVHNHVNIRCGHINIKAVLQTF